MPATPPYASRRSEGGAFAHPSRVWPRAIALGLTAFVVYGLFATGFQFQLRQTAFVHHIWTADAFLHGQLHVRQPLIEGAMRVERRVAARFLDRRLKAEGLTMSAADKEAWIEARARLRVQHDWTIQDGKLYGYWAPLTAVMSMPWVALFGPGVSDQLISAVYGAINIGLFYVLLRRVDRLGLCTISERCSVALALLLAFGTVHFYLAAGGRVWFTCQIVTLLMLLLASVEALSLKSTWFHALLAGVFFGAAILSRNVAAFTGLFFVVLFWIRLRDCETRRIAAWFRRTVLFVIPAVAAVGAQAVYNHARFGDVFDSGMRDQVQTGGEERFRADFETYGQFHPHFLATNAYYYLVNPFLKRHTDGRWRPDYEGNSMFLVTPPLLYLFLAWRRSSRLMPALLAGAAPLFVALLLFRATGFRQFGNRYLLDIMPFLLVIVANGMRGRLTFPAYSLIVLAVAAHIFGTYWMCLGSFQWMEPWPGRIIPWVSVAAAVLGIAGGAAAYLSRPASPQTDES